MQIFFMGSKNFKIIMSKGAQEKLSQDEAKMLLKMVIPKFDSHPDKNSLGFEKMGIWAIKNGDEIHLLTYPEFESLKWGKT
jgi:hypothetical protein